MRKLPTIYLVIIAVVLFGILFLLFRNTSVAPVVNNATSTDMSNSGLVPTNPDTSKTQTTTVKPKVTTSTTQNTNTHVYITIQNSNFTPKTITIKAGTTVTWINKDSVGHTVAADTQGPTTGLLMYNQSYSYKYSNPGIFGYHFYENSTTTGTIIVN